MDIIFHSSGAYIKIIFCIINISPLCGIFFFAEESECFILNDPIFCFILMAPAEPNINSKLELIKDKASEKRHVF